MHSAVNGHCEDKCVFLSALLSAISSALVVSAPSQSCGFLLSWSEVGYFTDHCPGLSTTFGGKGVITHHLLLSPTGCRKHAPPILSSSEIQLPALSFIAGTTWIPLRTTQMR